MSKKRREWIKTAAIILLAVLLVLTFFSNTIMNHSLPEVATQYVQSGSINARIRGSGTVSATETYDVTLSQTRKIQSVMVRVGDTVAVGDTLFILEGEDSDELKTAQAELDEMVLAYQKSLVESENSTYDEQREIDKLRDTYNQAMSVYRVYTDEDPRIIVVKLEQEQAALNGLKAELSELDARISRLSGGSYGVSEYSDDEEEIDKNDGYTSNAVSDEDADRIAKLEERKLKLSEEIAFQQSVVDYLTDVNTAATALLSAQTALEDAVLKAGQSDTQNLDNNAALKKIAQQREKVQSLSADADGKEVLSKVAGTVSSINKSAGQTAGAEESLASITVEGKGYTVAIPVTADQARQVHVGDTAEVTNYYWGNISAVLENIANDPQSTNRGKLLFFRIDGDDIEPGTNLSLAIGQRNANYDALVPNSALKSDANGDFVLIVTSKSSPLGNRYFATRVDVEVLAKDDTTAAVSGLAYGDFVITTSAKPINSGDQVRLVDGQ